MKRFSVQGMSCAACQSRIEKAVGKVEGVESCCVSLLTNSMSIEGNAESGRIIAAVVEAGYGARELSAESPSGAESEKAGIESEDEALLEDNVTPLLKKRLVWSLCFLFPLIYVSMGVPMLGLPLPESFSENRVAVALYEMILTALVMVVNQKFFVSGFRGILRRSPNMDSLVALGSSASFCFSLASLFGMVFALQAGNESLVNKLSGELYFESAAMILSLITVGKMLEALSKGKTTDALKALMKLTPANATVVRSGIESVIPVSQVKIGDIFIVKPGEAVPVDGCVTEGESAVDESALTGESIPSEKTEGCDVWAGTVNTLGYLKCRASGVGKDTTISKIIQMVSDAASTKAPAAKTADKISGIFVPAVILISAVTFFAWIIAGAGEAYAVGRAVSVLVISCPCALGLATPVAIMVGSGRSAREGVLFKTSSALEMAGKTKIVVLDKTGTITKGEPEVTEIIPADGVTEAELLRMAFFLESRSEHPLARAINRYCSRMNFSSAEVDDFKILKGAGISCLFEGKKAFAGSGKFIRTVAEVSEAISDKEKIFSEEGKTPLFFAVDGKLLGMICVADVIKDDSAMAVKKLQEMGIRVVMLTGDNKRTAKTIGNQAGVHEVIAEVLPDDKARTVESLRKDGAVMMVGDGINDAPALTCADTGVAIGTGADIAIDAADVVLVKNSLMDAVFAIGLSRSTLKVIHQNLFWAFLYNVLLIPLAAGVYNHFTHWSLSPMLGAAAMSLSSFCVVTNALRLNFYKMISFKNEKEKNIVPEGTEKLEENKMEKTMKIEGMMCSHCEGRVKKVLEAVPGVEEALVSHEKGCAVVKCSDSVSADSLKQAVEAQDYKVLEVK